MKVRLIYKSSDAHKVQRGDAVKITRIISSDAFIVILKKRPAKIEIASSVLNQMKRIDSIVKAIMITKKHLPKIEVKRRV